MSNVKIVGGEILCIGDLHISDVYEGRHKNYLENCFKVLRKIQDTVEERKPSAVVFLGDLIGLSETNIKSREVLSMLCNFFIKIKETSRVFVVRGNHDMKGYPDFQFLVDLGIVENCKYFDYWSESKHEVRFHIVNYGEEDKPLEICGEDKVANAVLAHNNFTIDGLTTWYDAHDGIELTTLQNFNHVDIVISGHIHNPSPELISCTMASNRPCLLFYVGCPTRPVKNKENYDQVWLVAFNYNADTDETDYDMLPFELEPYNSLYYDDSEVINDKTEEELAEEVRKEALTEVLGDIMKYRMLQGDPMAQVDLIPNASEAAKQIAKDYLQVAFNNERSI